MKLETIIAERLSQLKLFANAPQSVEETVEEFEQAWRQLGRELLEVQLQVQVEAGQDNAELASIKRLWVASSSSVGCMAAKGGNALQMKH
jgi:hypothetical protein